MEIEFSGSNDWHLERQVRDFSLLSSAWGAEEGVARSEFAVGEKENSGLVFFRSEEGSLRNTMKSSVL